MITLKEVVTGFERPVAIVDANNGIAGLYVVERGGLIKKFKDGEILDSTFLDVSDRLGSCTGYCEERGLLDQMDTSTLTTLVKIQMEF